MVARAADVATQRFVARISPEHIPEVWPAVVEHVADALEHGPGEITVEDVFGLLLSGRWQLLAIVDDHRVVASATVERVHYPQYDALRVVTLGGKRMQSWLGDLVDELEAQCRETGARGIEAVGRAGWPRALKKFGFEEIARHVFLEVNDDGQE